MPKRLDRETLAEWGPYPYSNREVLIFSMGSADEGHGPALSPQNDNLMAYVRAAEICLRMGYSYAGHIPASTDKSGSIARDWHLSYHPEKEVLAFTMDKIKRDVKDWKRYAGIVSHVVILSMHGGNNSFKNHEQEISEKIGLPVLYLPPTEGVRFDSKEKNKDIILRHAHTVEHSIADYLGALDKKKFRKMNKELVKDPRKAIEKYPPIWGLAGYRLSDSIRYESLRRNKPIERMRAMLFGNDKKARQIIATKRLGKKFFDDIIDDSIQKIEAFRKITNRAKRSDEHQLLS
jgi:creatinine amidohydrolase/Fe(II)-dependent formamide hydrolase-like protein